MRTVWEAFTHQARRNPAATAISGEADFSYGELLERATVVARTLLEGTRPGSLVALDAAGPTAGVIAFLAAAQAGCALLPLNTESPPRHRAAVLADAGAGALLHEGDEHSLTLERLPAATAQAARWTPAVHTVAYVLYTSGSTGRPKGVMVHHRALLNRLQGLARVPGFGASDSFLAMTALSFDISLAELLLPLVTGGRVIAAPVTARLDPGIFAAVAGKHQPSVIQATPSFWRLALAWGWTGAPGSRLWCGGEALTASLAARLLRTGRELWNMYGPTEATIWATASRIRSPAAIGLGRPLPGTGLCLADEERRLVTRAGQPGEILLYGDGLALGYLNQPDLTARRFSTGDTPDGPRLCYQTGDRARYRADGLLEFLGRTDNQVKLRGHRIELGELEAVMEEHPAVREVAAVLRDGDGAENAHIAAFIVSDGSVTSRQLREWLAERLPLSMRPSRIAFQRSLPRTAAGKVDRVSLAS